MLDYFTQKLDINNAYVSTCIGNHDIYVPKVSGGALDYSNENRNSYQEFEKKFYLKSSIDSKFGDRFKFVTLKPNIHFLSIDSTLGRSENKPGRLRSSESDTIINTLRNAKINERENLLIIGCHYPLTYFEKFPFPFIEGWYDHHFWMSGASLKDMINSTMNRCQILWLFGDTHYPSHHPPEFGSTNQLYIMSGRIGDKTTFKSDDELKSLDDHDRKIILEQLNLVHRQARIIEYNENNIIKIHNFQYNVTDYTDHPQKIYTWIYNSSENYKKFIDGPEIISKIIKNPVEPNIEQIILNYIKVNELYQFGRFAVRDREVSLGWVSLNSLLSDRNDILQILINDSCNWVCEKLDTSELQKTLIVGVDFWGAILASNISVKLNISNYSKVNKGKEHGFTEREIFQEDIHLDISLFENLIFVCDIVSSGRTLEGVFKHFKKFFGTKNKVIKTSLALSVLCDRQQTIKVNLDFLSALGTHCGLLRIPVVPSDFLPPEDLLPSKNYLD